MRANKQLRQLSQQILGIEAEPPVYVHVWEEVSILSSAFGSYAVVRAFEQWARENCGVVKMKPVTGFLKVALSRITGIDQLARDQQAKELVNDLVFASEGEVTFNAKQRGAVAALLNRWPAEEIRSVFEEFYVRASGNPYRLKFVAHDFCDAASQLLVRNERLKRFKDEAARLGAPNQGTPAAGEETV